MPLNTAGGGAGGGLLSSSALLIVILGVLVLLLKHEDISQWLARGHRAIREHFYGPPELYEPTATTHEEPEANSENGAGGAQPDPDDGFDYGIYAARKPPQ